MRVTVLGCGSSTGVPMVGNKWGGCDPANPRNRRTRPAILIERLGNTILVDAGPDLRQQTLAANVTTLDAAIITHDHADHVHGIDDLKGFALKPRKPLDVYATAEVLNGLRSRFGYMFGGKGNTPGYYDKAFLNGCELAPGDRLEQFGMVTFTQDHFVCRTLGLRCGGFAYSTDLIRLDEAAFAALEGIDTWIVAALRRDSHVAHANLATVLEWIDRIRPRRAILTHMAGSMDYDTLRNELPPHVEPAYDGMVIDLDD